jgi:hypothetical protein
MDCVFATLTWFLARHLVLMTFATKLALNVMPTSTHIDELDELEEIRRDRRKSTEYLWICCICSGVRSCREV